MAQERNHIVKVANLTGWEYLIGGGVTTPDIDRATKMTEKQALANVKIMRCYGHMLVRAAKIDAQQ